MNILLTAATLPEIQPTIDFLFREWKKAGESRYAKAAKNVTVLISGIGSVATAYALTRHLSTHDCQFAIQAGIAGSFRRDIALGAVVTIENEIPGDWGVENNEIFEDLFDTGLLKENDPPFKGKSLHNDLQQLQTALPDLPGVPGRTKVNGVTVNTVSGSETTIRRLKSKYNPDVESMEGAAFHYVCLKEKVPFIQLRGISNYVEIRDKRKWNIPLAIENLNKCLIDMLRNNQSTIQL